MSTELKSITAKIEIPSDIYGTRESCYIETEVSLTRFYGGTDRSTSLQLTFSDENGEYKHIQLDSENIKELKEILNSKFE
jgi:hypothetical protein